MDDPFLKRLLHKDNICLLELQVLKILLKFLLAKTIQDVGVQIVW